MASYSFSLRSKDTAEKRTRRQQPRVPARGEEAFNQTRSYLAGLTEQADQELRGLLSRRAKVIKRLGELRRVVRRMAELYGHQTLKNPLPEPPARFSKAGPFRRLEKTGTERFHPGPALQRACRIALMEGDGPVSTADIYDRIVRRGSYHFGGTKTPLASIVAALNSLVRKDEVITMANEMGTHWQWNSQRNGLEDLAPQSSQGKQGDA